MVHTLLGWIARPRRAAAAVLGAVLLSGAAAPSARAGAPPPSELDEPTVTKADTERQLRDVQDDPSLTPEARTAAVAAYREALTFLQQAEDWAARAREYDRLTAEAPGLLASIRKELAQPPQEPQVTLPADVTLAYVDQQVAEAQAGLRAARDQLTALQTERTQRVERRVTLQGEIARVKQNIADVTAALHAPAPSDEPPPLTEARRTSLLAQRQALERESASYEAELASYEARATLLPARIDRWTRRVQNAEALVQAWQRAALAERRQESAAAAREADRLQTEVMQRAPRLQHLADEIQELTAERSGPNGLTARLERVTADLAASQAELARLRESFRQTRRKVEAAGLTFAMGPLLRKQYEELAAPPQLRRRTRDREAQLSQAQYQIIVLEERREAAGDVERQLADLIRRLLPDLTDQQRAEVERVARDLLETRRNLLDSLIDEYWLYFERLGELDSVAHELTTETAAYRSYIEERILWVRSPPGRRLLDLPAAMGAVGWLLQPRAWFDGLARMLQQSWLDEVQTVLVLGALVLLFLTRAGGAERLARAGDPVGTLGTDSFLTTLRAAVYTVHRAAPFPLLVWFIGWRLGAPADQPAPVAAAAAGLRYTAVFYAFAELLRQVLKPGGLADVHFWWAHASLLHVRRQLRWVMWIVLPMAFLAATLERQETQVYHESLGRLAFVVAMIATAVFGHRIFGARFQVFSRPSAMGTDGMLRRLHGFWHALAVGVPIVLAALALFGYYYTALQLERRLNASVVLVFGLVIVDALLLRWLFVVQGRMLAREQLERLEEEAAAAGAGEEAGEEAAAAVVEHVSRQEAQRVFAEVNTQTRRLFESLIIVTLVIGLYGIWANVLPALRMFDRIQVWPHIGVIESERLARSPLPAPAPVTPAAPTASTTAPAGAPVLTPPGPGGELTGMLTNAVQGSEAGPPQAAGGNVVTLADVGLALIILAVTIIASRNVPGLLEILLLQRLALDAGARYAAKTVARYVILIVGLPAAFAAIGIGWAKVQWLAAALTFGLAFGLQEIFANFVSGLIILLERPIRVGDTVTVGDIHGTVAQIRMRATTIVDWDRKELIVPNKSFITDQLINWTLSDPVLRVTVPVGIEYGSDVQLATRLMLEAARANPNVLEKPEPECLFWDFGDNALVFHVRVFVPDVSHRFTVPDDLRRRIDDAFRAAGVVIAFPQRDLHLKSADVPIEIIQRSGPAPAPAE